MGNHCVGREYPRGYLSAGRVSHNLFKSLILLFSSHLCWWGYKEMPFSQKKKKLVVETAAIKEGQCDVRFTALWKCRLEGCSCSGNSNPLPPKTFCHWMGALTIYFCIKVTCSEPKVSRIVHTICLQKVAGRANVLSFVVLSTCKEHACSCCSKNI